jgi:chromosome segregation ATPase
MAQRRGRTNTTVKVGAGGLSTQQIQTQITNISSQISQAEKPLKAANDKLASEQQAFHKVELEHKQSMKDVSQAKKFAEEQAKNLPELKAAQKKAEEIHDQLAEVRKRVIESLLKDKEEYRAAVKAHDDAIAEQKSRSNPDTPEETRKELSKKMSDLARNRKTIEDVAMADDSEAKQLTLQNKEALAEVAAASKKKHDLIENDPKTASAKIGLQRANEELKKAKASLDQASAEQGRIMSQLQALNRQRANLQSEQQMMQKMQSSKGNTGNTSNKVNTGKR